ncbi:MAG: flagellar hook-basal body complex protein, partial [Deltaproteobacteria bacterium]
MSLRSAMYSGVSGLSSEGDALGIVGDNVANENTVGFKQSRAVFEDVLGAAIGSPGANGAGVRMARSQQIFAQGSLLTTGQPTDLGLSGDGFFVVRGSMDGVTGEFYTRAGQTSIRGDGTLINPAGLSLQGNAALPDGTFSSAVGDIQLSTAALPPRATTGMNVTANLDATSVTPTAPWDPANPGATSNFSTTMTAFDSLGNPHALSTYFCKTA